MDMCILLLESPNVFFGRHPVGTPSIAQPEIKWSSSCALDIGRDKGWDDQQAVSPWCGVDLGAKPCPSHPLTDHVTHPHHFPSLACKLLRAK